MPDANYFPLIVGVISFFASVSAAVLAGIFVRRNEEAKWLRQERLIAYSAFLGHSSSILMEVMRWETSFDGLPAEVRDKFVVALAELFTRGYVVRFLELPSMNGLEDKIVIRMQDFLGLPPGDERDEVIVEVSNNLELFANLAKVEFVGG